MLKRFAREEPDQVETEEIQDSRVETETIASVGSDNSLLQRRAKLGGVKKFIETGGHSFYVYDNYCLAVLLMLTGYNLQQRLVIQFIHFVSLYVP